MMGVQGGEVKGGNFLVSLGKGNTISLSWRVFQAGSRGLLLSRSLGSPPSLRNQPGAGTSCSSHLVNLLLFQTFLLFG